jgi:hypothetical protein
VILLNQVIQILAGPDERLCGQDAFGLQFGDGFMGRPTAVECDLLQDIIITDCLLEEVYEGYPATVPPLIGMMARRREIASLPRARLRGVP